MESSETAEELTQRHEEIMREHRFTRAALLGRICQPPAVAFLVNPGADLQVIVDELRRERGEFYLREVFPSPDPAPLARRMAATARRLERTLNAN
jgi:hypothetical protein